MRFFDDNTRSWWTPLTGGSNIPALNDLLSPFGIAFGDTILTGLLSVGGERAHYSSGTNLIRFPGGGFLHRFLLQQTSGGEGTVRSRSGGGKTQVRVRGGKGRGKGKGKSIRGVGVPMGVIIYPIFVSTFVFRIRCRVLYPISYAIRFFVSDFVSDSYPIMCYGSDFISNFVSCFVYRSRPQCLE